MYAIYDKATFQLVPKNFNKDDWIYIHSLLFEGNTKIEVDPKVFLTLEETEEFIRFLNKWFMKNEDTLPEEINLIPVKLETEMKPVYYITEENLSNPW